MKHTINYDDLLKWMENYRTLYASANGVKKLYCTLNGGYEVEKDGKVILKTNEIEEAVETYNDL